MLAFISTNKVKIFYNDVEEIYLHVSYQFYLSGER